MRTSGSKRNWRIITDKELRELYEHLGTVADIKKRRREWIEHQVNGSWIMEG